MNRKNIGKKTLVAYGVSAPALILISSIVVFPIIYTFYISLTNMNTYHWFNYEIIGLDNYKRALTVFDSGFFSALLLTILLTAVNIILQLCIAFLVANLLNSPLIKHQTRVYETILMFPWAMPGYVSILLWKTGMFNTQFGLLNTWVQKLGLESRRWLSSDLSAFICCTVVNLWLALPFMIMIMDGGLKSIDKCLYESATIDGAGKTKQAMVVTIPCLKPIIWPSVVITIFTTFKTFDVIYLMVLQTGSQTGAHIHTIITYAYENAFITNNYGYSSAISIIIFVMLIAFSLFTNRRNKDDV